MKSISLNDLESINEENPLREPIKKTISIIISSANDWPGQVISLEEFELEVRKFISATVTELNIESALGTINYLIFTWQAESLTQLKDIFKFYKKGISFEEIVNVIKTEVAGLVKHSD